MGPRIRLLEAGQFRSIVLAEAVVAVGVVGLGIDVEEVVVTVGIRQKGRREVQREGGKTESGVELSDAKVASGCLDRSRRIDGRPLKLR